MVNFSQSHLVENIQVHQSTKNRTAQEGGKKHSTQATLFLEAVQRPGQGCFPFPLVCGFCRLYTCCQGTGGSPHLLFCPLSPPQFLGNSMLSDSFSGQSKPYQALSLCCLHDSHQRNKCVTHIGYLEVTLIQGRNMSVHLCKLGELRINIYLGKNVSNSGCF